MLREIIKGILEKKLLSHFIKSTHIALKSDDCHSVGDLGCEQIIGRIKQLVDWPSLELLLDENARVLTESGALSPQACKSFASRKYCSLEAMPELREVFEEQIVALYRSSKLSSESEGEEEQEFERAITLSEEKRLQAHQHFKAAVVRECEALDIRVYFTDDRGVRRHDSLSRVLSLSSTYSVCTAVTVYNGRLIVSANSTGRLSSDQIATSILAKLNILKTFIDTAEECFLDETEAFYTEVARIADLLSEHCGVSCTTDALRQALIKLYRSSQGESENQSESNLLDTLRFSDALTILLPSWKLKERAAQVPDPGIKIYQKEDATTPLVLTSIQPFAREIQFSGTEKINSFHAEQLLVVYLEHGLGVNLRDADGQLIFGISKLTCEDCARAMASRQAVVTRGTSGLAFDAVAYVTSPLQDSGVKRLRPLGPTGAHGSPFDSAEKKGKASDQARFKKILKGCTLFGLKQDIMFSTVPEAVDEVVDEEERSGYETGMK